MKKSCYNLMFSPKSLKTLKKMDKNNSFLLMNWIDKNLNNCNNPHFSGKSLTGDKKDYWRYRVGQYRIIVDIKDNVLEIVIINFGHRKDIYKK